MYRLQRKARDIYLTILSLFKLPLDKGDTRTRFMLTPVLEKLLERRLGCRLPRLRSPKL